MAFVTKVAALNLVLLIQSLLLVALSLTLLIKGRTRQNKGLWLVLSALVLGFIGMGLGIRLERFDFVIISASIALYTYTFLATRCIVSPLEAKDYNEYVLKGLALFSLVFFALGLYVHWLLY